VSADEEFYVGWQERAPAGLARHTRRVTALLALAAAGLALALAAAQRPFALSAFEFGVVREFRGILVERPHPALRVARPGRPPGWSRYLLVGPGKRGARELVEGLDGRPVRIAGSLIHADGQVMIEVVPGSAEALVGAGAEPVGEVLGERTLRGEIADAKCHLGVMNPGRRTVHRECAINCIAGGVPPVLLLDRPVGEGGGAQVVLLVGPRGEPLGRDVLPLVAVPVEVTGTLERNDDLYVLRAAMADVRRLDSSDSR